MTVQTSYPGVYIQEIPSLVHTITAAPTSVAVFVGYTHPFLTKQTGVPVQLFSFADYQANFGGFFSAPWQPDYVGHAVFQFFQNGGQTCFVVGLAAAHYYVADSTPLSLVASVAPATAEISGTPANPLTFTAKQPVGLPAEGTTPAAGILMTVLISNVSTSAETADIVIFYGTTVETYRQVSIAMLETTLQNSNLVQVSVAPGATYPAQGSYPLGYGNLPADAAAPLTTYTVINPADFASVFLAGNPLDKVPVFNLLATPGITDSGVWSDVVAYCEGKRAFYIADTPSSSLPGQDVGSLIGDFTGGTAPALPPSSINAAVYYPWLMMNDPITGQPILSPPSGFVAGIYGQEDSTRGVWKSPAGTETALLGTTGPDPNGIMTDLQQGVLNSNAIDCLRQFPGIGTVVFGARTTAGTDVSAQQQWKYIAVRRTALFIEQTLYANLTWAVFEPNAAPLWHALTQEVTAFMLSLFRQGAFAGTTPSEAFVVQCDATTTTPTDVANGTVNILVGFAPLVPAEFVVVQITQLAGQAQS
jgi:phage tail sheath protein FI